MGIENVGANSIADVRWIDSALAIRVLLPELRVQLVAVSSFAKKKMMEKSTSSKECEGMREDFW